MPKRRPKIQKPPVLFNESQKLIAKLEAELGMPLITYWSSANGSVCQDDVVVLYELCRNMPNAGQPLGFFIKSSGGSGRAALRITHLLRQYAPRLTALVPLECASAATMMALGADDIRMGPLAAPVRAEPESASRNPAAATIQPAGMPAWLESCL